MKQTIENGKWKPENGTFVRVPNEQIPEVIQMLRENGFNLNVYDSSVTTIVCLRNGWWETKISKDEDCLTELSFSDFKALVTGKLPESWCIQCTEESMNHEAWSRMIFSMGSGHAGNHKSRYYGIGRTYPFSDHGSFGEVLQIETWAAVWEMKTTTRKNVVVQENELSEEIYPDEVLINELKS